MTSKEALKIALHSEMKISTEYHDGDRAHLSLNYRLKCVDILVETRGEVTYGVAPDDEGYAEFPYEVLEVWDEEFEPIDMTQEELEQILTKVNDYEL